MEVGQLVTPLRRVLWGGILVLIDFVVSATTSDLDGRVSGYKIDILSDFIGMIFILLGVRVLVRFATGETDRMMMNFIYWCAVLNTIGAFLGHAIVDLPLAFEAALTVFKLVMQIAVVLFAYQMLRICLRYALHAAATSWRFTLKLIIFVWAIPLGILELIGLWLRLTDNFDPAINQWSIDVDPSAVLMLVVILFVPLIHYFVSLSRMRRHAAAAAAEEESFQATF